MRRFEVLLNWATSRAPQLAWQALASVLHHRDAHGDCLVRRQGRCPGLEHCADCSWKEGTTREQD